MKRFFFILVFLVIIVPSVRAYDFTISNFHANIMVHADSSFMVEETIDVHFLKPRHGIYREIPVKYDDEFGRIIRTPLSVFSVTDGSGKNWKTKIRIKGNVVNIRIGDPKTYVNGNQTYVIAYTVKNALLFFEDHDELYWNVTGNYWRVPIKQASAHVMLPSETESSSLWAACYTGHLGSRASACGYQTEINEGSFVSDISLKPREGFTIAFGWDKGIVTPPSEWQQLLWKMNIRENWTFILPICSLLIMIFLWDKKGRDPRVREAVTVRYEPPVYGNTYLTPAEVGTLSDEKIDSRDITSSIVGLAVKGFIRIEETVSEGLIFKSEDYYLAKVKEADDTLSPFEKVLMQKVFKDSMKGKMVSDMNRKFYTELEELKKTLHGELVSKKFFRVRPDKVRRLYATAASIITVLVFIAAYFLAAPSIGKSILAGILTALPVFLVGRIMPAKTRTGASVYMEIMGFEEFMNRAEKDRLERMGDKNLFSKFLPYAIALDVVDNWADAFEGIYQEAPQWYVSSSGVRTFSPHGFSRSIQSATSSMSSAMFSAPRGSGGSGGFSGGSGFSGGGFGGGGGGSW